MKKPWLLIFVFFFASIVSLPTKAQIANDSLKSQIKTNAYFQFVKSKALEVMKAGFNAGDGYREVWIRDFNTFIELASKVNDKAILKENLLVFFRMQGDNGNILDGFTPIDKVDKSDYNFYYSIILT